MKEAKPRIFHKDALTEYFGGLKSMAKSRIPYRCKCGSTSYDKKVKELTGEAGIIPIPMMSLSDCYKHIRQHKEITLRREVVNYR